ncbi:MAG: UDP-N-acetylglucosamine diphosphorylase/glucosamine-1-phosphate N-acetyltransferase [Gammaproteobacteria bacterium]|nr:MAG: UDP-N-acetylglucosamine diphosphorylase/glucosamine-1-phosphate N-acetyltransferase [Gammaproteobacteria bacterium]
MKADVIILAAGQGTRMKSDLPKVLHRIAGQPMLQHVVDTARDLAPDRIIVVHGHGGDQVRAAVEGKDLVWVEQDRQLGTGHAVEQALPRVAADRVLVLYGDVPLIRSQTLERLLLACDEADLCVLTAELADPRGYGRIVRKGDEIECIVEEKDASPEIRSIREVNTGIMAMHSEGLRRWIAKLDNDNAQGEFYLTDCVALAREEGARVRAIPAKDPVEIQGVNDRKQLAMLEREWQRRVADELMTNGTTLMDPVRLDVRGKLFCGRDCEIDVNCVFEGVVVLGDGVKVGPNCIIRNSTLDAGSLVEAHSIIEDSRVGKACRIGPFARLRPGSLIEDGARIGNFVEVKNSRIGQGSKVNHLSYIGDTEMGREVNIGAGTITCNYDGANKHRTVIGDRAFVGSDTQLVAPVKVGADATIGAGSTITRDAPEGELTLSRSRQTTVKGWQRPRKEG